MAHSFYSSGEHVAGAIKSATESLTQAIGGEVHRCGSALYAVADRAANIGDALGHIEAALKREPSRDIALLIEAQTQALLAYVALERGRNVLDVMDSSKRQSTRHMQQANQLVERWRNPPRPKPTPNPALVRAYNALERPHMTSHSCEGLAEVVAALMFVHEAIEGGDGSRTTEQFEPVPPECLDDLDLCAEHFRACFAEEFAKLEPEEGDDA